MNFYHVLVMRVITFSPIGVIFSMALTSVKISLASGKHSSPWRQVSGPYPQQMKSESLVVARGRTGHGNASKSSPGDSTVQPALWITVMNEQHCAKHSNENKHLVIYSLPLRNLPWRNNTTYLVPIYSFPPSLKLHPQAATGMGLGSCLYQKSLTLLTTLIKWLDIQFKIRQPNLWKFRIKIPKV